MRSRHIYSSDNVQKECVRWTSEAPINSDSTRLTIDGIRVTVPSYITIWSAAWRHSIFIPTLCPRFGEPTGACRLCVVDAGGRVFSASCVAPVADGMVLSTSSERVRNARRTLIDLLTADYPMPCSRQRPLKQVYLTERHTESLPNVPGLFLDWSLFVRCRGSVSPENTLGVNVIEDLNEPIPEPSELMCLPNLKLLSIVGNNSGTERRSKLQELLDCLGQFKDLRVLWLRGVALEEVPPGIADLKNLFNLALFNTGLTSVPDFLASLPELKYLNLSYNQFEEIPGILFLMKSLTELRLACADGGGHIKHIPHEIQLLEKLQLLDVDGQPIETPPREVVDKGAEAVKNYWRQREEVGFDYLCEAKLIILGEGGAGKTSLAKKIQDRAYQLRSSEESTEGIDVMHWSFPAGVRIKADGASKLIQSDFGVNIWDFGGQEIYHATHQFFLTRRSLYVLVADDRKEDTDFNYWLQVVELLGEGSPLLIVQNEKQDRRRDINWGSLRARFASIRATYRVNLASNRGLDELVDVIRRELECLPHIGVPLPATWSRVRQRLESDERNYIGLHEYLAICDEHGFKRREDKLQLSGYLHDLGICLHFQDDALLKKTVILKPKWGTDAVYRVLDDQTIMERHGRFGPGDLARIWSEEEYAPMRDELLRLMMKFQLCYEVTEGGSLMESRQEYLPHTDSYIVPQLLSPTQPAYQWDGNDNLVLRYEYDFMPKGLLMRLIVALNHRIVDQNLVWKSGVILEYDNTQAEVIEDYPRRRITIRVAGEDRRKLLVVVDEQLERIHLSFVRLKYEKFLPCNCEMCRASGEPYTYPLKKLEDFASKRRQIQCYESGELVDAAGLISDVLPGAVKSRFIERDALAVPIRKEVFVSYAWTDESSALVNRIELALKDRAITLVRDKNEMKFKDSIREFMERIGRGSWIVVVISKRYLESKSCMFELTQIAAKENMRDRVFPVVVGDANIYDAVGRLDYIEYWEKKIAELESKKKAVTGANLQGIDDELNLFVEIRSMMARIMDILGDMNAQTPEHLLAALEARLAEG